MTIQKAILVGVNVKDGNDLNYSMKELKSLAEACEIEVMGQIIQNLTGVNKTHYIGTGKVAEVLEFLNGSSSNMVIFNDELSPSQLRNLEAELKCKVIDRTFLILEIFEKRAKTKEAMLQVEVAQLQYMLPRLIGLRNSLGRQSGGRNKGTGEKKLELDRRQIEDRLTALNKELESLVSKRKIQRSSRKKNQIPVVSLVGYTNAGKSTLMNALIKMFNPLDNKQVFEKDMLFATLETSARGIQLPNNKSFVVIDTVGFVDKLPHHLIKAFRSTLEEATEANLMIHVVDYSNPNYEQQVRVADSVLKEIGVGNIPIIYAYNKLDLVYSSDSDISIVEDNKIYISAKQKVGMDKLVELIHSSIFPDYIQCKMLIPYTDEWLVSYLNENAHILNTSYENSGTVLRLECKISDYNKYSKYLI